MTALPCSGGTGNGLLQPDGPTDWAGAVDGVAGALLDDAGGVLEDPGLADPAGVDSATCPAGEVIPAA